MESHDKTHDNPPPDLARLWKRATEELGLSPEHEVCRDILRLGRAWNDAVYRRVERALKKRINNRENGEHFSDRVPPPGVFTGALPLAAVPTPSLEITPVLVDPVQFVLHTIITGLPGKGKTWLCRRILNLIAVLCPWVRILVFDPNRSYASLASDPAHWLSISWQGTRLNPLVGPPYYPEEIWHAEFIDRFGRGELMHSRYLVATRLGALVEIIRRSATPVSPYEPPSLCHLRDNLARQYCRPGSREDIYRQSALNVLDGRIRTSGSVYDCTRGMESLLTNTRARVCTEGLAPVENLDFFIGNFIHYLYRRRSTEPLVEPPALHTLIVVEEAQTILQRRAWHGITFYQEVLLRARSLGLGFVFVTQDISRIDPVVLAACSNYFVFGESTWDNKRVIQNMLDLSNCERDLLGALQVGECFVRLSGHPLWPHPFLARIPHE